MPLSRRVLGSAQIGVTNGVTGRQLARAAGAGVGPWRWTTRTTPDLSSGGEPTDAAQDNRVPIACLVLRRSPNTIPTTATVTVG